MPVVALGQCPTGVRHPEELEVVVGVHQFVDVPEHCIHSHRHLRGLQEECRHDSERAFRDDAQCTDPDPRNVEHVRVGGPVTHDHVPGTVHDSHALHLGGETAYPRPRPVGGRRDCSGDGLVGDVAQVRQGETLGVQQFVQAPQRCAGTHRDRHRSPVDAPDALEPADPDHQVVRDGSGREAVTRCRDPHRPAACVRPRHEGGHRHLVDGVLDGLGPCDLVSRPVGPFHATILPQGRAKTRCPCRTPTGWSDRPGA